MNAPHAVLAVASALVLCACAAEETSTVFGPARPLAVQNVSYVTSIYYAAPEPSSTPPAEVVPAEPPPAPVVVSSGFATCDAYLAETERCAAGLTSNPEALARFEHSMDVARREDRIIAERGSATAKADVADRCAAALRAYDDAACLRR